MTNTFAKSALAGAAAIMAFSAAAAVPSFASAQSASYYGDSYYDPCQRSTSNRSTTGGLLGALAGAAIGSNVAARNARTEGAVLGGVLGAAVGAKVGKNSAGCAPQRRQGSYGASPYSANGYSGYDNGYAGRGYDYDQSSYDNGGYDRYGQGYNVSNRNGVNAEGCSLAESPIYLPDGRVQKRFVRVCQDARGNYQVVD